MSKSKHSPALFEVIGNKPQYTQSKKAEGKETGEGSTGAVGPMPQGAGPAPANVKPAGKSFRSTIGTPRKNEDAIANSSHQQPSVTGSDAAKSSSGISSSGGPATGSAGSTVPTIPRPRPMVSPQPAGLNRYRTGKAAADLSAELSQGRSRILGVRGRRIVFSLNPANGMIAAGCVFFTLFVVYLLGYRSGTQSGTAGIGDIQRHLDEIAIARRKTADPSVLQIEATRRGNGTSKAANPAKSGKTAASLAGRTRPNAPVAIKGALARAKRSPKTKAGPGIKPVTANLAEDPRVPGQTYIVVEYFPKSPDHDALAECRHVSRYLAGNGIMTFIVAGRKGYQLVTRKGFTYSTQREACLAYKQRIRKLAKGYKPLDRTYMFIGFEKTYRPKE